MKEHKVKISEKIPEPNKLPESYTQRIRRFFGEKVAYLLSKKDTIVSSEHNKWLPAVVFVTAFSATVYLIEKGNILSEVNLRSQLNSHLDNTAFLIQKRISSLYAIGDGLNGFFNASGGVVRWNAFQTYIDALHIEDNSPEVSEIGIVAHILPEEMEGHIQHMQEIGFQGYGFDMQQSIGNHVHMTHMKSFHGNRVDLSGYDYFSDPRIQKDMELAVSLKASVLSQQSQNIPGVSHSPTEFLISHPLFGQIEDVEGVPNTGRHIGWSVIGFDVGSLLAQLPPQLFADIHLKIYSGSTPTDLLFNSNAGGEKGYDIGGEQDINAGGEHLLDTRIQVSKVVKVANKEWLFVVESTKQLETEIHARGYNDILEHLGIPLSFILTILAYLIPTQIKKHQTTRQAHERSLISLREGKIRDSLTGVLKLVGFLDGLQHLCDMADRHESLVAILYIGLDGFRQVNDTYGRNIGDEILRSSVKRIQDCIRDGDILARLGGDEFIIAVDVREIQGAIFVAKKVRKTIQEIFMVNGHEIGIGISIGISMYPGDIEGAEAKTDTEKMAELIAHADMAKTTATRINRDHIRFFSHEILKSSHEEQENAKKARFITKALTLALENDGFSMNYQPIVEIKTGKMVGMEALVRCDYSEFGYISPGDFIPIAEKNGMIIKIGAKVICMVCEQVAEWKKLGITVPRVAINLSAMQIQTPGLIDLLEKILRQTGVDATELTLEITESMKFSNQEQAIATIAYLSRMGFKIAIDDFGTGYSNFTGLMDFCVSVMKIDRSFVLKMNTVIGKKTIGAAIAAAKAMDMKIVAEGVESQPEVDILREMGCDYIQGYHYSKPRTSEDITPILNSNNVFDTSAEPENYAI